ncbi:MAG: 4Fe-4S dicluster domain-containing protein [Candidatus Woesearchaeota archaeon]
MEVWKQDKKRLVEFLDELRKSYELVAPVKKDLVRFEIITDPKDIHLEENSYFPVKEFFFKKHETIFTFNNNKIECPNLNSPNRVFFGLRRCDLNAVKHQDMVFIDDSNDPYYKANRENSILIGLHCNSPPSKYCFCGTLDLEDFHDLMYYDKGKHYLVEGGSEIGKSIIHKYKRFFQTLDVTIEYNDKKIKGADRLKTSDIGPIYSHSDWEKGANICYSCSACTALCPTCYCFEMHDNVSLKDLKQGKRCRNWSSCQLKEFSKVAGEHVFRDKRVDRFKHRIYHQLVYFKEKYGTTLCVGCGRCIKGCPVRIDFVKIINEIENNIELE